MAHTLKLSLLMISAALAMAGIAFTLLAAAPRPAQATRILLPSSSEHTKIFSKQIHGHRGSKHARSQLVHAYIAAVVYAWSRDSEPYFARRGRGYKKLAHAIERDPKILHAQKVKRIRDSKHRGISVVMHRTSKHRITLVKAINSAHAWRLSGSLSHLNRARVVRIARR